MLPIFGCLICDDHTLFLLSPVNCNNSSLACLSLSVNKILQTQCEGGQITEKYDQHATRGSPKRHKTGVATSNAMVTGECSWRMLNASDITERGQFNDAGRTSSEAVSQRKSRNANGSLELKRLALYSMFMSRLEPYNTENESEFLRNVAAFGVKMIIW